MSRHQFDDISPLRYVVSLTRRLIIPALLAAMTFAGPASAAPNEYSVSAGGNLDWSPASGGDTVTSGIPVTIDGTLSDANGRSVYLAQSGPGIARVRQVGSFRGLSGATPRFDPNITSRSTQELTVSGPGTQVSAGLNVHVDGGFTIDCPDNNCGVNLSVQVQLHTHTFTTVVNRPNGIVGNTLGLTIDPISGGYHIYGDVQTPPVTVPVNSPFTVIVTVVANVANLGNGLPVASTWDAWVHHVSFAPSGPVLDLPTGYSVSGENVSDNAWTPPFTAPASVSGTVVYDFDGDGIHDPSETLLDGITVFADTDGNGEPDTGEPLSVTDPYGRYVMIGLAPDIYTLDYDLSDLPADFFNTGAKPLSVTVSEGDNAVGHDFFVEHPVPALVADYRFADTRASSVGTPPDLVDIGVGNAFADAVVDGVNQRVLTFPEGNGLALQPTIGVIPNDRYTLVMDARLDTFGFDIGAQLLDFTSGTESFKGLSIFNPFIVYFEASGGCFGDNYLYPSLTTGQWFEVAISRDQAGFVRVFVDGDEKLSCNDSGGFGVVTPANVLRFFRGHDIDAHGAGAVSRIRLYENAMTAEELAVLDEPGPSDLIVTDCDDPALGQLTVVTGDLIIENLSDCDAIELPNLVHVGGDVVIRATTTSVIDLSSVTTVTGDVEIVDNPDAVTVDLGMLTTVGGSVAIDNNDAATVVDLGTLTSVGGSVAINDNAAAAEVDLSGLQSAGNVVIEGNTSATTIDLTALTTVGDVAIVDNGTASVVIGMLDGLTGSVSITTTGSDGAFTFLGSAAGSVDINAANYTEVNGMTARGATGVQIADGAAVMRVELPEGSFDTSVAFTITRLDTAALEPEIGENSDGTPAMVDLLTAYEFSFDIPTLNLDATLTFEVLMAGLDVTTHEALLAALDAGTATLVTRGDQSSYQAFPVCAGAEQPTADGCISIERLDGAGQSTTSEPVVVRFTGVTGHFSTWGVAVVGPVEDSTPPLIDPHADVTVEATGPSGAIVAFTVPAATDDEDGSVAVTCAPASGSLLPLGSTTISCSAQDTAGNTATSSFQAVVQDTTPPTIATPADITVTATGQSGAWVNFQATASDVVDGVTPADCTPAPGSQFAVGTSVVTCGKVDANGNTADSATFNVTVQPLPPPETSITGGPANGTWTASTSATFTLVSSPTGASFGCTLDGAALAGCTSPLTLNVLTEGTHTLVVAASGPGGADATPATRTWHVDSIAPVVTITTPAAGAVFTVGASVTPSVSCTDLNLSTCTNTGIDTSSVGVKTFQATGTDLAGNTKSESVTYEVQAAGGDVIKPIADLLRPLPGQTWKNDRLVFSGGGILPPVVFGYVTFSLRATDNIAVSRVLFRLNGVTIPASQMSHSGSNYSFLYRPTAPVTLDNISYTATDTTGNSTTKQIIVLGIR